MTTKDIDTITQSRQDVLAIRERLLKMVSRMSMRDPHYRIFLNATATLGESFDALTDVCRELNLLEMNHD